MIYFSMLINLLTRPTNWPSINTILRVNIAVISNRKNGRNY